MANSVNNRQEKKEITTEEKQDQKDKKMDGLSLVAHIAVCTGIACFFLLPQLGLLFVPAGFIMGVIAWAGGKRRYKDRRGRGLALAAMALGGVFTMAFFASIAIFLLTF